MTTPDDWFRHLAHDVLQGTGKLINATDRLFTGAPPDTGPKALSSVGRLPLTPPAPPPGGGGLSQGAGEAGDTYGGAAGRGALTDQKLAEVLDQAFKANDAARQKLAEILTDLQAMEGQLGPGLPDPATLKVFAQKVDSKLAEVQQLLADAQVDAQTRARILDELRQDYQRAQPGPGGGGGDGPGAGSSAAGADPGSVPGSAPGDPGGQGGSPSRGTGSEGDPTAGLTDPLAGVAGAPTSSLTPALGGLGSAIPGMLPGLGAGGLPLDMLGSGMGSLGSLAPLAGQAASQRLGDDPGAGDKNPNFRDTADHGGTESSTKDAQFADPGKGGQPSADHGSAPDDHAAPATPGDGPAPAAAAPVAAPGDPSKAVTLPDGTVTAAPTAQAAEAIRAVLRGSTPTAAYQGVGITLPPPGTPVTAPIDPSQLRPGDVAQFKASEPVIVLGNGKVWLNGQVQPQGALQTGPDFMGWIRPSAAAGVPPAWPAGLGAPPVRPPAA